MVIMQINSELAKQHGGGHGGLRYCGIAVSCFSSGISVILILMCGIAVSSSPGVCSVSSFLFTVFGKRISFTVLRCQSFALSSLIERVDKICSMNHSKLNRLI